MSTIQDPHLPCPVRCQIGYEFYIETSLRSGKMLLYGGWSLNDPKVEWFCLDDQIVFIPNGVLNLLNGISWKSRNNAINECITKNICSIDPLHERCWQFPKIHVINYGLL